MQCFPHLDRVAFLKKHRTWLEQEEVKNGLFLGLCAGFSDPVSMTMLEMLNPSPVLLILQTTPKHNAILAAPNTDQKLIREATKTMYQLFPAFPGAVGPRPLVEHFVESFSMLSHKKPVLRMDQFIYRLEKVRMPPSIPGQLREAGPADEPLLAGWMAAFSQEAMSEEMSDSDARRAFRQKLEHRELWVWDQHGIPRSMVGLARPTRHGITINYVYTPPESRGQGLAANTVAHLSQRQLNTGYSFCSLYTDAQFPTSNALYQRLGYYQVCESAMYGFE
jgi:uncharacterized protein